MAAGRDGAGKVLMVAEKPSIARSIADILSRKTHHTHKSAVCGKCPVHEFGGEFRGRSVGIKVTSVLGHVMKVEFDKEYRNWDDTDPADLFLDATIHKEEANPGDRMREFLRSEAKGCQYLVLWLDCDNEGENICFEVIKAVKSVLDDESNIFRAKFSALSEKDIMQAMKTLGRPDYCVSRCVDARQELDLRIGCAFTRFQNDFFHTRYANLNNSVISYGPCQTPTLGFCVDRQDAINEFKPEKYWTVNIQVGKSGSSLRPSWSRHCVFDREVGLLFQSLVSEASLAKVESVTKKKMLKEPPPGLKTVELLRAASTGHHIGPHEAMSLSERLYIKGLISYPRTETTAYPDTFDFKSVVSMFLHADPWDELASQVHDHLMRGFKPKKGAGQDVGDHPPITPTRAPTPAELSGSNEFKLFDYVMRHFLGSLLPPCEYYNTEIVFSLRNEEFSWNGITVISEGFTSAMPWKKLTSSDCPVNVTKGETWDIKDVDLNEHLTSPPQNITESELIGLMEKHGIGTDASIPVHIDNICQRHYVSVSQDRKLTPTQLGMLLVHGYRKIDPELVLPTMRSDVEWQLNLIAQGKADYDDVCEFSLDIFKRKFEYFRKNMSKMEELFSSKFETVADVGKKMSRCGQCHRYTKLIEGRPPKLLCEKCDKFYSLPLKGAVRPYEDSACPLDGFGLIQCSIEGRGKSYILCPKCYNDPPFEDVPKPMGCNSCTNEKCAYSKIKLGVRECQDCHKGDLVLDPYSGRKWQLSCNNVECSLVISLCSGAAKVVVTNKECSLCSALLITAEYPMAKAQFGEDKSYTACMFCDERLHSLTSEHRNDLNRSHSGGGRGRGGHRGGRGRHRGGRGRGGRGQRGH
jgi:DNA topoisomerase-3